jgi:hypothetical protein
MKQVPQELRNKSAVGAANVHRDLPTAGPSGAASFRTEGSKDANSGDRDFVAFAQGNATAEQSKAPQPLLSAKGRSRAAHIATTSFTADDLKPRTGDSADVLELLNGADSLDDLDDALSFLSKRQEEQRKREDHLSTATADSSIYTSENHPYLFNLLHLPDEEAITAYLSQNTYSSDVWGLPGSLKQDLDAIKDISSDESSRGNALRRLTMLKRHLALDSSPDNLPTSAASRREMEQQEEQTNANGFDYTDWIRIYNLAKLA